MAAQEIAAPECLTADTLILRLTPYTPDDADGGVLAGPVVTWTPVGDARAHRAPHCAPLGTYPTTYPPLGTQLRYSGGRYLGGVGTCRGRYLGA